MIMEIEMFFFRSFQIESVLYKTIEMEMFFFSDFEIEQTIT